MNLGATGINVIDIGMIPFFLANIFDSPGSIEVRARTEDGSIRWRNLRDLTSVII